jgi:hypothetical protein
MSYNWTPANTPQGRERLKDLLMTCERIPVMVDIPIHGKFIAYARVWDNDTRRFSVVSRCWEQSYLTNDKAAIEGIQFLDPEPQPQAKDKPHSELGFGDYVCIEQFRYGVPNEFWEYKVIGVLRSNCWVDIPVKHTPTEVRHESMEDVICCICCGIDETKVVRFKLSEVIPHRRYWELNHRQGKEGGV